MLPMYRCDVVPVLSIHDRLQRVSFSPSIFCYESKIDFRPPPYLSPAGGIVERRPRWAEAFPRTQRGYALPITRILHCPRAGAGRGSDEERAPQPGAGSARRRRAWCRYQCWREEPGASSRPWRHAQTARTDDRTQRLPYQEALDQTSALPSPTPRGYALPIPGVNHVRISGDDRYGCCCRRLGRWQCAAPAVLSRAGWIAVAARHARVAQFGVRQPCCRASRAHDPARGIPLTLRVAKIL